MAYLILLAGLFIGMAGGWGGSRDLIPITNLEGATVEAHVFSVVRTEDQRAWICFRKAGDRQLFLYPFSQLSRSTLDLLSETFAGEARDQLIVADGLTGRQIEILEQYLAADPREQLILQLREARRAEIRLSREWKRLQDQTWQVQKQLAQIQDPNLRAPANRAFQASLHARDRTGKQLVLLQAEIRRMEGRVDFLRRVGVPIGEKDFFAEDVDQKFEE